MIFRYRHFNNALKYINSVKKGTTISENQMNMFSVNIGVYVNDKNPPLPRYTSLSHRSYFVHIAA